MMKRTNLFLLLIFCSVALFSQEITESTLIKVASTNPLDIPYEKWELPNGLKVLIHEDHSDPLVHIHVTYHVGSNRETAGKSGFAHFFEHMMFQGSENVPDEEHFKIINDAGGSLCELEDQNLYKLLSENSLIVYIKTNKENERVLIERAKTQPKPMYYNSHFFEASINTYLSENNLDYVAQVSPDDFVSWVFPKLIEDRLKKYAVIANKYGCTIQSDDLHKCRSSNDVINLISSTL